MGKRKKSNLSEIINNRNVIKKSLNPFEIHVNRQKFNVLNRKMKADRGLPGVAKAKALKKRKETLLQEYKVMNKSNKFHDRRIGEKNSAMTKEDRIIARFSAERMKAHKRKDIFNLADDEVLTHKGQSIAEIEKFDDPLDDDDGDIKGLDANFVEEANFGGGVLSESKNNRASVIEQLIADSKKRKAERQLAKERTLQKTEELDAEWKELIPIVNMGKPVEEVEKKDSYDIILNDLKFEPRGTPSDKLKTESEIAEEESRKLKELEEERLRRMRGEDPIDSKPKSQHRSADDLDDCFDLEEDSFELTYDQEGNAVNIDKVKILERRINSEGSNSESENEESDGENGSEEEEEELQGDDTENREENAEKTEEGDESDTDDLSDLQIAEKETEENDSEAEGEVETTSVNNEIPESNMDVKDSVPQKIKKSPEKANIENFLSNEKLREKKKVSFGKEVVLEFEESKSIAKKTPEEIEKDKEEKKVQMEKARKELPYAFEVPETYEKLQELFKERTFSEQAVIIERVIKCNHPSLNEKNKEKLENLFAILMQHLNDADSPESWSLLDRLAPYLFDLAQFSPGNAAYCLSEVLLEKHSDYLKKMNKYPTPDTLVFLKLVPLLFPTSDKRHPVTTPAFIFISEMLHHCHVTTKRAIASGLFLVSIFSEYICLSKRIMPEALNFLCGVIHLATPSTSLPVVPPFKKEHKFLFLHKSYSDLNDINLIMQGSDLMPKPNCKIDDTFRIKAIYCALKLVEFLAQTYQDLPACKLLFEPIKIHLDALEVNKYPMTVQRAYEQLNGVLDATMKKNLEPIIMEAKKPKALRLYEPSIQPVYDMKKKNLPPEKAEHTKLLHKYRKEMKGALREIRRDRQFISKIKFKEQSVSDAERKRKVKEIYSWGAQQQSEFNKHKRKKK